MNVTEVVKYRDTIISSVTKNIVIVIICFAINFVNVVLIHIFCKHEIFYTKPRYILFIHLVFNDMLMLTLSVLLSIVSYIVNEISVSVCTVIILVIVFTTENTPLNLACMALECYIAICFPLHHSKICTVRRTHLVIAFIWTITMISGISDLFITLTTLRLEFFYTKVMCLRNNVFPSPIVVQKRNYSYVVLLFVVWFVIFYTHFKILFSAKAVSKDSKKARNTVILHGCQLLMCMTIYVTPGLRDMLIRLFPRRSSDIHYAVYVVVQILPRSLSPIVYGVKDTTFRKHIKRYLVCKVSNDVKPC